MYTHSSLDGARLWFPCVDTTTERCTYELQYTVDSPYFVISSGDLQQQVGGLVWLMSVIIVCS